MKWCTVGFPKTLLIIINKSPVSTSLPLKVSDLLDNVTRLNLSYGLEQDAHILTYKLY